MAESDSAKRAGPAPEAPDQTSGIDRLAEEALASASAAADALRAQVESGAAANLELPSFDAPGARGAARPGTLELLDDVSLDVRIELGRTQMYVEDVLRLGPDSVVELDKPAGEPVDIYVNDRHVARGEVLVLDDNFCIRVSEIIGSGEVTAP
jgi:flagellar motor switch protein FliN/FliY